MIYIDYLEKGKTVAGLYYVESISGRFDAELLHLAKENSLAGRNLNGMKNTMLRNKSQFSKFSFFFCRLFSKFLSDHTCNSVTS